MKYRYEDTDDGWAELAQHLAREQPPVMLIIGYPDSYERRYRKLAEAVQTATRKVVRVQDMSGHMETYGGIEAGLAIIFRSYTQIQTCGSIQGLRVSDYTHVGKEPEARSEAAWAAYRHLDTHRKQ